MDAYPGKYFIQGGEIQEATILILKDRLSIGIRDEHGNPRIVYWPFDQIIRDNFWKRGEAALIQYKPLKWIIKNLLISLKIFLRKEKSPGSAER
jgi:hypothetical protein